MKRDTVGKISSELIQKMPESQDPIELERAMHENYERHIFDCVDRGTKEFFGDFYVIVITKRERLMNNVIRDYFFPRQSCPTPDWDQVVYRYHRTAEILEFLWVIPSKDTCEHLTINALSVVESERDLLNFVLEFNDGSLLRLAKKLNGEQIDSPLLEK